MRIVDLPPSPDGTALVLHGGAGEHVGVLDREVGRPYEEGLAAAYAAGRAVLDAGGAALDAVCATVVALEDYPLFNAGRGAVLNSEGEAELDAAVMIGAGRAGAVAASSFARNPVLAARAVLERTPHVLIVAPAAETVRGWGLETADPAYFLTEARQRELTEILKGRRAPSRHGTVGAVALDQSGHLAAATSTGGVSGKQEGRIGDTPLIGAGTYAADGAVGVSCTGIGEAFIEGVVAHEISARVRYARASLSDAVAATLTAEVLSRDAFGGSSPSAPTGGSWWATPPRRCSPPTPGAASARR